MRIAFDPGRYRPNTDALRDRTILVTGASSGLGRAAAMALATHGATVILLGRTLRRLQLVYDAIVACGAPTPLIAALDFAAAGREQYESLRDGVQRQSGRLDGLVLNAARLGPLSPIAHHDPVQWLTTMHVNVNAPFLLTRHLLGLLRCGTEPAILFAADGEQREPKAYWGAYAVAKHALAGFATVLAEEHGPTRGLRVCTLEFGPLATGLRQAAYPGENPRRWPAPERVANAFVYALGPEGRDLHGRTLQVLARKCDDLGKFQADPAPDIDGAD